ncbi:type 1 glutamine amidotransferase [Cellulomonas edaphi]|uniref:Type 1 glutamine amidotransferase n=1 Tax=Cellulomonas edaphi TaxID=3053468 RepID=A0ABT7S6W5_9CELL|nr:type 1 glutamine amidotransferase [Cellulomons edaphi]MDM7831362.1 type 1 glutamine amidotransferase [Cellulomons edaphi]
MRPVLVLTHAAHEGPGLIAPALDAPVRVRTVVSSDSPVLPALDEVSGIVVMGGAMDADDDRFPGLDAEKRLLAEAVAADVPVLGVCLGMQLLALALGGELHRRHGTEIGFAPVDVVADDPVHGRLGPQPTVLHWHHDAVSLPPEATLLASTTVTPVQAFRAGSALAVQYHPELEPRMLDLWLATPEMVDGLSDDEIGSIRSDGAKYLPDLAPAARAMVAGFAEQVRARG